jgi:diguanylate cyclase (GGDEF)-like protein
MALSFMPVVIAAIFPSLRNYGVLPASFLTHYALAIGAAVEVPILLWVLSHRARDTAEAQVRSRGMDTRDPLTGLTPTALLLFRLRNALVRARRNQKPCALLGVNLSNYAEIQAAHGREVADRALVVTATRLASIARDVDTVARTDTQRFAVLMESPVEPLELTQIATRVVARGLNESVKLPRGVILKLHVAGLIAPEAESSQLPEASDCLQRVNDALNVLPSDGRKAITHLNY